MLACSSLYAPASVAGMADRVPCHNCSQKQHLKDFREEMQARGAVTNCVFKNGLRILVDLTWF